MIGIVVSGHINFASGMESAVRAIAGEQEQMTYVDFVETMSSAPQGRGPPPGWPGSPRRSKARLFR